MKPTTEAMLVAINAAFEADEEEAGEALEKIIDSSPVAKKQLLDVMFGYVKDMANQTADIEKTMGEAEAYSDIVARVRRICDGLIETGETKTAQAFHQFGIRLLELSKKKADEVRQMSEKLPRTEAKKPVEEVE